MYSLRSEDLTHLGGRMGTEYATTNWIKYFSTLQKAKEFAEKDYNNSRGKIKWRRCGGKTQSQDLGYVIYYITKIKEEE